MSASRFGMKPAGFLLCVFALGCSQGSLELRAIDQASSHKTEARAVASLRVPEGFRAVMVVEGLNYPSSLTWDQAGRLYILESHTVPIPTLKPRILRIGDAGKLEEVKWKGAAAPSGEQAVGLTFHGGWLYVSHEEKDGSWGVSRVRPEGGDVEPVVRDIPSRGDHSINHLAFDRAGTLYFGVGTATNSGVVSSHDPVNLKWITKRGDAHDIACRDLVLSGRTFAEEDDLTPAKDDRATTGAYQAYGQSAAKTVRGQFPCTGALLKLRAGSRTPELVAWGLRNPVALAFEPSGTLLVGTHGADVRGTRPVLDDPEAIYRVREGAWYGWPDFAADLRPITDSSHRAPERFFPDGHDRLEFVIDHKRSRLKPPDRSLLVTITDPHAALGGMTIVPPDGPFSAWAGQLLLSEMGDFKPTTDPVHPDLRTGFQVEAVDLATGRRKVFARNRGTGPALPASLLDLEDGFERPVDVRFGPDGLLYVLDYGVFNATESAAKVFPKTGKVFRIEPAS